VINDVSIAPRDEEAAKRFTHLQIGALVNAPSISNDGRWRFVLSAMQTEPRLWRADEIELLKELSARMWLRIERARAEESLRAAHNTFRHLVENSPFGVYTVDADFRVAQVSAGAQPVFENVRPLIGRDFAEVLRIIWPEPFASEAIGLFRNTLETGEPYHSPNTVERRQDIDEVGSFDWKIERVTLPDGRFGVVCHFYDLSERQHYEAALRESEERLRLATEAAEMFSWEYDLQQQTVKWSENTTRLLDCGPEELPVDLEHSQFFAAPTEIARLREEFAEFLRQGISHYTQEFRGRDEGDQTKYWRAHGLILYDAGGAPLQVVGITQNITKRKQAKVTERLLAEMRERNRLAQELHDTVAQALGYLNLKMSTAQTLLDSHDIEAAKAQLHELKSVIGEAYTDVREEIFNLKAKLRSNMSFMEMLQRYIDKYQRFYNLNIQLVEEAEPTLFEFSPEVTGQLVRIIQEALINIRKHAQVNTATIRLGRTNGTLRISIEDTGQGFDPAQSQEKSSSFGLQIMRERIESIGGSLEIETFPGQGTRVTLYYKRR
ncbi:MAG: histidine kinase, partial [Acidiferrobacterales bacterium]|nr:histidine kinase [Acidiferrobacterales bacterium]